MPDATLRVLSCLRTCAGSVGWIRRSHASGNCAQMPDATLTRLIMPKTCAGSVGRIRRSRRIRQLCPMPDTYINAPIIFNSSSSGTRYTTAHAAPAQTTLHNAPARTQLRRHQQHRVFPRRFHLLFTCGIVLWNWLSIFGSTGTLRASLCRPVALDSLRWSADFQLIVQRIHRQLLLANERMGNLRRSARRTSAASRI